jgi:thiamine-phosphate pyrophosphorylase
MSAQFSIRIITEPREVSEEASKVRTLLESGLVDYVHIRKPDWSVMDVRYLIEALPYHCRKQLILHGHYDLLNEMNLGGVSLNSRNRIAPANAAIVGIACHSVEEALQHRDKEFVTLSPIYPSISKPGYKSEHNLLEDVSKLQGMNVIALGGVTPDKFAELQQAGFSGAALLGYVWERDIEDSLNGLKKGIVEIEKRCYNI